MKYSLRNIADIILKVTGITLYEIRSDHREEEIVNARQAFLLVAEKYGDYSKRTSITKFIKAVPSTLNYAQKVHYKEQVNKFVTIASNIIEQNMREESVRLNHEITQLPTKDRISIVNNLINSIPIHMRAAITL